LFDPVERLDDDAGQIEWSRAFRLTSTPYDPQRELTIHPLDPALALPWPDDVELLLSERDQVAPTLAEARASGLIG